MQRVGIFLLLAVFSGGPTSASHQSPQGSVVAKNLQIAPNAIKQHEIESSPKNLANKNHADKCDCKLKPNWWEAFTSDPIAAFTLGLLIVTSLLALYTAKLFRATNELARQAKSDSERQSLEMRESITAAADAANSMRAVSAQMERSANAAENSVRTLKALTSRQMRAYLSIGIGGGIFQERRQRPLGDLWFEASPLIINTGHTPAHNVKFRTRAGILAAPLIGLPPELPEEWHGGAVLGPNQNVVISAGIHEMLDDARALAIKNGVGDERLYIWGEITYEDVFDRTHWVKFCQTIHWLPDGKVWGYYTDQFNETDRDDPL